MEAGLQILALVGKIIRINHIELSACAESGDEFFGQRNALPYANFVIADSSSCRLLVVEKRSVIQDRVGSAIPNFASRIGVSHLESF
jgi:hypothetical protein